ncbi:Crp/Fnr family transcriptional regulator [Pseudoalteromonas sp. S4498]|uniref:Crp/Fnr family transcriptional regulator n=1 Tax=Pseudoalteromonas TaxID=53246 RepID=UPI0011083FEF|nr:MULTISPECIES: Crp/Fnr family transcriptional regulator [Pseudoalteromonas]MCG9761523.1 Crp/Fnr family transcriptional regulator [Pseudoalteromonas sp. Isolate6]NKC18515.1 Crp/Fnr family transcriptional regulator [Pseudoalteromonas galatheae]
MPFHKLGQFCEATRNELLTFIRENPTFGTKRCGRNEILLQQGQMQHYGFFIHSGKLVSSVVNEVGELRHKEFYFAGELCILFAEWIQKSPSFYQISALDDAKVVLVPLAKLEQDNLRALKLKLLQQQLLFKEAKEAFLLLNTLEQRYCFLRDERPHWVNGLANYDLANYLGVTPQGLSRLKSRVNNAQVTTTKR